MKKDRSILLSRIALWIFLILLIACDLFCIPTVRLLFGEPRHSFAVLFRVTVYALSVPAYLILWWLRRLLRNLQQDIVFVPENVRYLRFTCWGLTAAFVILLLSTFYYVPFVVGALACGFMALIVHIVKNVFEKAGDMKDELDLTV